MTFRIVLAVVLAGLVSLPAGAKPPDHVATCTDGCWAELEQALKDCAAAGVDPEACAQEALGVFMTCVTECSYDKALSVYRWPDGRHQLLVRAKAPAPPADPSLSVREHLLTVPVLAGVTLRNGMFPDLESLSSYVMETYAAASQGGTGTGTGGTQFNGPPRIFILLPSSGPGFMPVGIGGTNFDRGTVPYINSVPSVAIFNFSTRNIPLLGSISVGFTIVPPASKPGPGDVMVEYNGQQSNRFPFTKN
jgi:hypothetical protein